MKDNSILVFDADRRFEYTKKELLKNGFRAISAKAFDRELLDSALSSVSAVLLPLPVSRDGVTLNYPSFEEKIPLDSIAFSLSDGTRVLGGMFSQRSKLPFLKRGLEVFDYYDEEIILQNAVLTARALMMFLEGEGISPEGKKILITGFGRTAKEIAKLFREKGFEFIVSARSEEAFRQAEKEGISFVKLDSFTGVIPYADIIINTVPALIFDKAELRLIRHGAPLIDIASAPYGADSETAESCNVRLVRALSLPGKFLPEESGKLIAQRVITLLRR